MPPGRCGERIAATGQLRSACTGETRLDLTGKEHELSNRTYRVTEIVGTSPEGIDQAIRNGVARAAKTLRHVDWFEVTQIRGQIKDGDVEHFQVGMKLGFRLEDE